MMNPTANWSLIPEHLRSSVEGYLEYREHPGDYAKDGELRIAVGRKLLNLVATIESILPGHWRTIGSRWCSSIAPIPRLP